MNAVKDSTETLGAVILVGNPNVGKSVVFGALTGRYVNVSNYPGTTVEVTRGEARDRGTSLEVIDTPGVYSLLPMSEDERVTRDILMREPGARVLQVCDAKNMRRSLMITAQLAEMELPLVLAVNMADEARERGVMPRLETLEKRLGVPAVPTVAVRKKGTDRLLPLLEYPSPSSVRIDYGSGIETAILRMEGLLPARDADREESAGDHAAVRRRFPRSVAGRERLRRPDPGDERRAEPAHRGVGGGDRLPGEPGAPVLDRSAARRTWRRGVADPFLEKHRAGVRPVLHGPRVRNSHPAGRPGARLRLRRCVRRGIPRRPPAEVVLRRLARPVRRGGPRPVRPLGVPAGLPGGAVRDDLHGPFLRRRDRPSDRRHLFPRVRDPGGLRVPAPARGDGRSPLQEDRLQRQGGASDDPRARVRHDGDLDHADPRDAAGNG